MLLDYHLFYNALKGSSGLGAIRFHGTINGVTIHILLDSGSSNNFLHPRIANFWKLPIEPAPNFQVLVGNGHLLVIEGLVKQLEVMTQGHYLHLLVYLLPIAGADLVLGTTWLATMGPHILDYSKLTLKYYKDNQYVTLHGERPQLPRPAQFHHLKRMNNTHAIAEVFEITSKHGT